jgi:hypothetical protein
VALDPARLPTELVPYADALELRAARPSFEEGWRAHDWPSPTMPLIPGDPPYDGVYRGSWLSPGVCLRLDLSALAAPMAALLRARHPDRVGGDGAFYTFGIAHRSQRLNRDEALLSLALALEALSAELR